MFVHLCIHTDAICICSYDCLYTQESEQDYYYCYYHYYYNYYSLQLTSKLISHLLQRPLLELLHARKLSL